MSNLLIDLPFDIQSLDIEHLEALRNACSIRLLAMRRTDLPLPQLLELLADVKVTLRDQGKDYHGLDSWEWRDGCIRFWLNPVEQDLYKPGWYSIDELIAWTHDCGAVMFEEEVEAGEPDRHAAIEWLPRNHGDAVLV